MIALLFHSAVVLLLLGAIGFVVWSAYWALVGDADAEAERVRFCACLGHRGPRRLGVTHFSWLPGARRYHPWCRACCQRESRYDRLATYLQLSGQEHRPIYAPPSARYRQSRPRDDA